MSQRPRILLTSVARPFGRRHGDAFSTTTQALHQLMWAQDIFRIEDPAYHWGLDVIAANISAPTVVLHYPSLRELARELRKGYDYIGISFNPPTFHKLKRMIPVIRKHAPQTKIVLGGHGTALRDDELEGYYDLLCREEGIQYFRKLLGEPDQPFRTPPFVFKSQLFSLPLLGKTAPIFGGVGCTNGCDFCMTSHYFNKRHTRFLQSGEDVLRAILEVKRHDPEVESFVVYDEDLLLNQKRGREFLEACRATDERFTISVFASVKALSQYEPTELAEMGVNSAWIGFEGMQAGYAKQEGKPYEQLFRELKDVGISPAASMIIGYDYQTLEVIEREYAELLRIKPDICQFLIYGPTRNTPLFHKLDEEGRLDEIAYHLYPMMDGFTMGFAHPNISAPTMKMMARQLYRGEYHHLGPSVFRVMETALRGYRHLKGVDRPRLRIRAAMQKEFLVNGFAAQNIGQAFAPNNLVRARLAYLFEDLEREFGPAPPLQKLQSYAVLPFGLLTRLKFKYHLLEQSPPRRHEYNMPDGRHVGATVSRRVRSLAGHLGRAAERLPRIPSDIAN
ncbi:MAG: hypothetical protein JRI23_31610 [Deltaproteobacteria bacterium]|jgi:haloalkane dehalogenase|nr:hypothetical protein [Deltaproteobacteria bacterium]MBW2536768.1 hypothetical protein [Deltaproteobacteria bacterium]